MDECNETLAENSSRSVLTQIFIICLVRETNINWRQVDFLQILFLFVAREGKSGNWVWTEDFRGIKTILKIHMRLIFSMAHIKVYNSM